MFESKYSKVLTIILVIVIIGIIGLLAFLGYDMYQKATLTNDAEDFVDTFQQDVGATEDNNNQNQGDVGTDILDQLTQVSETASSNSSQKARPQYKGFGVVGTMKIPAINLSYPILEKMTTSAMENSIVFLWGVGVNEVGNSVISGHNYRNGLFFSNLKKLNNGDRILVTDNSGKTLTYTIYNKFEASETDTSFYQRDTNGAPELTLSTCTDDGKARTIILARAE